MFTHELDDGEESTADDSPVFYRVSWTTSNITAFVRVEEPDSIELATRGFSGGWNIRDTSPDYLTDVDRVSIAVVEEIDETDSPWANEDTTDL